MDSRLREAALNGDVEAFRSLLDQDPLLLQRIHNGSALETPLHIAILREHVPLALELLDCYPRLAHIPDHHGQYPLHLASTLGLVEIVKKVIYGHHNLFLCEVRNKQGRTPIELAAMTGQIQVLEEMLTQRQACLSYLSRREDGGTDLLQLFKLCIKYNHVEVAKCLIKRDVHLVNKQDDYGNTVLHIAVATKQIEMLKFLLELHDIDVNIRNSLGCAPLDELLRGTEVSEAVEKEMTELLLHNGAKYNTQQSMNSSTSKNSSCWKRFAASPWYKWFNKDQAWLDEMHNSIMVVAALIATVTFQAALDPPGGFRQETEKVTPTPSPIIEDDLSHHEPRKSIFSDTINSKRFAFESFMMFNMIGFHASLSVILLLISGIPLKNRFMTWILVITMWTALLAVSFAFIYGAKMIAGSTFMAVTSVGIISPWQLLMGTAFLFHIITLAIIALKAIHNLVGRLFSYVLYLINQLRGSGVL